MTTPLEEMADSEIDALVAEKVMGWIPKTSGRNSGLFWSPEKGRTQVIFGSGFHASRKRIGISEDLVGDGFVFSPSTSISDAWLVVEKLEKDGMVVEIDSRKAGWAVNFWKQKTMGFNLTMNTMIHKSAPRAICLAALKALETKP